MKKFTKVLALALALMMVIPVASFAGPHGIIENPAIVVSKADITVDGNIDEAEGYSEPAKMNYDTCGFYWAHNPLSTNADVYYAYDEDGIYIAADIFEGLEAIDERTGDDLTGLNSFVYSTGVDNIDISDEDPYGYGWNGDVFGVMFDPLGALMAEGFTGSTDLSANYLVGLFEGDEAKVFKLNTTEPGDVTDKVEAAGHKTETGWCFELKISWDDIVADTIEASFETVEITKETILSAPDALIRTNVLYQDRFFDTEQNKVDTWGRYMTAPTELQDGTPGHMGSGEGVASYGITLNLKTAPAVIFDDVPTEGQWYSEGVYYCAGKGYITGTSVTPPLFAPNGQLTREQFVTILARVAGAKLADYTETKFTDVDASAWYGASVIWANEEGYVNGVGDGSKFGVGQAMTREQLATMFFRYAEKNGVKVDGAVDLNTYEDGAAVANWAASAVAWAVDAKLLGSTTTGKLVLSPQMTVTRAQAAKIFMSYDQLK